MKEIDHYEDDDMFGPGMDLIISLLCVLLIVIVFGIKLNSDISLENDSIRDDLDQSRVSLEEVAREATLLREQLEDSEEIMRNSFPPNIIIEGAGKYAFDSGKAELNSDLKQFISNELVEIIENDFSEHNINIVEVIGHTDGQIVGQQISNLDENLEKVVNNQVSATALRAGSNADLGLMRALAVVTELQRLQKEGGRLKDVGGFRAHSAAQLTLRSGDFAKPDAKGDDSQRRRIEIRFTRFRSDERRYGN